MTLNVKDVDKGARALIKRLQAVKGSKITVGVHGEEGGAQEAGGLTVADVATIHEFGLGNSPARPWLSGWAEEHKPKHLENMRKLGEAIVTEKVKSAPRALDQLALAYEGSCKEHVIAGVPPENKPATVARKGSSTPLVDTGQFVGSIRGKVSPL